MYMAWDHSINFLYCRVPKVVAPITFRISRPKGLQLLGGPLLSDKPLLSGIARKVRKLAMVVFIYKRVKGVSF